MTSLNGTTWTFTPTNNDFVHFKLTFEDDGNAQGSSLNGIFSYTGTWTGENGVFHATIKCSSGSTYYLAGHVCNQSGAGTARIPWQGGVQVSPFTMTES